MEQTFGVGLIIFLFLFIVVLLIIEIVRNWRSVFEIIKFVVALAFFVCVIFVLGEIGTNIFNINLVK